MSARRFIVSSLALTGLIAAGCHQNQQNPAAASRVAIKSGPATQPTAAAPGSTASQQPQITDATSTADSVAQKANVYASQMAPLLAKRGSGKGAQQPPTTQPVESARAPRSDVPWTEPKSEPLNAKREALARSNEKPITDSATIPNTGMAVTSASVATRSNGSETGAVTAEPPKPQPPVVKPAPANPPAESSDDLTRRLAQHVKDYPQDLAGQLEFQLMRFVRGDSVPDMQSIAGLPGEDREMLSAVLDGLTNFRSAARADNNLLLSRKIRPLLDAADRLRTQAELNIPTVALCKGVINFGSYEPFDPPRFPAGVENKIVVYCEIENFASRLDSQKMWETSLREEIVLYSDQGLQVWTPDKVIPRPTIDRSRARRHDFFLGRLIKLPANLSIGRYILKVSVVDQQVNRVAENSVPLEIVAQ